MEFHLCDFLGNILPLASNMFCLLPVRLYVCYRRVLFKNKETYEKNSVHFLLPACFCVFYRCVLFAFPARLRTSSILGIHPRGVQREGGAVDGGSIM